MRKFEQLTQGHIEIIKEWLREDDEGEKRLGSYNDPQKWLDLIDFEKRFGWIFFEDNVPIGFVDMEVVDRRIGHIASYISPNMRKRGYCKIIHELLFQEVGDMNLEMLVGSVEEDNVISRKCMDSLHFVEDGKDKDGLVVYKLKIEKASKTKQKF